MTEEKFRELQELDKKIKAAEARISNLTTMLDSRLSGVSASALFTVYCDDRTLQYDASESFTMFMEFERSKLEKELAGYKKRFEEL